MGRNEYIMENDDPRIDMYREYYFKAKYAIEKAGLDVTIKGHEAKQIFINLSDKRFDMFLSMDVVVIFVDGERVFYFDPEALEVESFDGSWMKLVDIIYQSVIETDRNKSR